jgi:hypothetical protein
VTSKLTDADVTWLRREAPSGRRLRRIARAFGCTERYLFNVIFGNARPDVPRSTPAEQLKLKFGRCPVGIRVLSEEEFNRPRRGQHFSDAERLEP